MMRYQSFIWMLLATTQWVSLTMANDLHRYQGQLTQLRQQLQQPSVARGTPSGLQKQIEQVDRWQAQLRTIKTQADQLDQRVAYYATSSARFELQSSLTRLEKAQMELLKGQFQQEQLACEKALYMKALHEGTRHYGPAIKDELCRRYAQRRMLAHPLFLASGSQNVVNRFFSAHEHLQSSARVLQKMADEALNLADSKKQFLVRKKVELEAAKTQHCFQPAATGPVVGLFQQVQKCTQRLTPVVSSLPMTVGQRHAELMSVYLETSTKFFQIYATVQANCRPVTARMENLLCRLKGMKGEFNRYLQAAKSDLPDFIHILDKGLNTADQRAKELELLSETQKDIVLREKKLLSSFQAKLKNIQDLGGSQDGGSSHEVQAFMDLMDAEQFVEQMPTLPQKAPAASHRPLMGRQ